MQRALKVDLPPGGHARADAVAAVRRSGLGEELAAIAAGPFGHSSRTLGLLEALVDGVDLGLAAASALEGLILEEATPAAGSFAVPRLAPEQRALAAAFQIVVMAAAVETRAARLVDPPDVEGALEADGLAELLEADAAPAARAGRVLSLGRAFLRGGPSVRAEGPKDAGAVRALAAFFVLLRRAVEGLAEAGGTLRPLVKALEARQVSVEGRRWEGLRLAGAEEERVGLLPVRPDQIVGNEAYLQAGLRLARDVAGYDLERRQNPKRLNPVLFGLGRPGCGKTVTAHAVGNYFLDYCRGRGVPARFVVVRRTDWASSYQNASASNLVRIFREEVYGGDGVAGVYWPDIDTAFASRESEGLRVEEKQNLAAVFGIFDGTLLPRDGKWFMICDANTLHMDEATVSRIAQSPHEVLGPTTSDHYLTLMRDVSLADLRDKLPAEEAAWQRIGGTAEALALSGRTVESVCNAVRAVAQDFEYPDGYFGASFAERERIVASLGRPVSEERILALLDERAAFERDAAARAETDAFDREVDAIVRHLNATRAAAERAADPGATPGR